MSTPGFRPMWEAARAEAGRRSLHRRKLARAAGVAGALLLFVALIGPALRTPAPPPDLVELAALSARLEASTTDFLLETPGLAQLETTPAFGDPLEEERWSPDADNEERT